jgi:putative hydrolase of the HAD superfamily
VADARRGLLVDFGGVLTSDLFESFSSFCLAEGIEPNAVRDRFRSDTDARALLIALEEGRMEEHEFEPRLAALLEVHEADGLIERLMAGAEPDLHMIDAVRAFRAAGVRTGLVSNSWGTRRYDRPMLNELFDGVVISGEVGIRKPAPAIYALGAERIGLPPAECVFVDDLAFNLDPARELGMAVVHHTSAASTLAQLERLVGS